MALKYSLFFFPFSLKNSSCCLKVDRRDTVSVKQMSGLGDFTINVTTSSGAVVPVGIADIIVSALNTTKVQYSGAPLYEWLIGNAFSSTNGADTMFALYALYLVFFMHLGFAMLTAGCVRAKNAKNACMLLLIDWAVGTLAYYLFGYAFAFGAKPSEGARGFIGSHFFAMSGVPTRDVNLISGFPSNEIIDYFSSLPAGARAPAADDSGSWGNMLFQWSFCITAAAIVSGSVCERVSVLGYSIFSFWMTSWIYPVYEHWVWDSFGWFGAVKSDGPLFIGSGYIDYAGSGVVHTIGGVAALWGAIFVGPRIGRIDSNGKMVPIPGHSSVLVVLGTMILIFGWYGFNPGSALAISLPSQYTTVMRCAINTTIAPAAAAVASMIITRILYKNYDVNAMCNCIIGGLVAITAPCSTIENWAAVICGIGAAIVYHVGCRVEQWLKIDDPLDAVSVHALCGNWGLIVVGLFAARDARYAAYGNAPAWGAFMGGGGDLLACQLVGICLLWGWVSAMSIFMFAILKYAGILRVSPEEEIEGLDTSKHGGACYPPDYGDEVFSMKSVLDNDEEGHYGIKEQQQQQQEGGEAVISSQLSA